MKSFRYINLCSYITLLCVALFVSCKEDEFPQATITFYPALFGEINEPDQDGAGTTATISLVTSRTMAEDSKVNIRIKGEGAGYGYSYTTNPPQLEPGVVTLTIPYGESATSFTFTPKYDGIVLPNDYNYTFTIEGGNKEIRSVGQKQFKMKVKEGRLRSYDFNSCSSGVPAGFSERIVSGAMAASTWACTAFGYPNETTSAVEANAFGKGVGASNSYLVMDAIDANTYSKFYINLLVYSRFAGAGEIKLVYSTNYTGTGDPEAVGVVWTELTDMNSQIPDAGTRIWQPVGGTLEGIGGGNLYLAIKFVGGTTSSSSNWRIENFEIKAE